MTRRGRIVLAAAGAGLAAWLGAPAALRLVPLPAALCGPAPDSAQYVDRTGRPLREVPDDAGYRERVSFAELPPSLVAATLAAEDRRFFEHRGVDWLAVARALRDSVRQRRVAGGASGLTQQLIKVCEPRPRTLRTKVVESLQALRLEQVWGKERILEEYVNRVDYGNRCIGVASAARYYFGRRTPDLGVAESALLAALPQAPTRLNPHRNPGGARARRDRVLALMERAGRLEPVDAVAARAQPLGLAPRRRAFVAPQFVDLVRRWHPGASGRVVTTLDPVVQAEARGVLREQLVRMARHHVEDGAVVVLDNATGDVLALVGSDDFFDPEDGQVNGAWAPRSAGSAFKPFTYLLALERGLTPATVLADTPCEFPGPTGVFRPVNYDRRCRGPVLPAEALGGSLNIPAVRALERAGGPAALRERLTAWGLTTLTRPAEHYGLGLTIGNAEARLLELANAYATLARLGEWRPWRVVRDREAPVPGDRRQVADRVSCWLIADMLSDNAARAGTFGFHSALRFPYPVACKTGTSTDYRDNWAFGYTPEFTVGVWVGNFDNSPMQGVSGVSGAAPVMHAVMDGLHRLRGTTWYPRPDGVVRRSVHPWTGRSDPAGVPVWLDGRRPVLPPQPGDRDAQGRVVLSSEYAEWCASAENALGDRVTWRGAASGAGFRLVSPQPGGVYFLDPDLPAGGRRLTLRSTGGGAVRWSSPTLPIDGATAELREGRHEVVAEHPGTGERRAAWIDVKAL